MARIGFGRVEGLVIRAGQPVLTPAPRMIREIKFGAKHVHREPGATPVQVTELFSTLKEIGDGLVDVEIRHGLPFRLIIAEGGQL